MPITYNIDHDRKLVAAVAYGVLTDDDVFRYQRGVWSRTDVAGYDEVIDMSEVTEIVPPSVGRIQYLATLAATMPSSDSHAKFAIIAPTDIAFGLGRMFQAFRGAADGDKRRVEVFRTPHDAMAFLTGETAR